jgi:hypothetical protein
MTKKMIEVKVYFTPSGAPTCAKNWETGEVCRFLVNHKMGFEHKCQSSDLLLNRGGDDGLGYLEPHKDCELHVMRLIQKIGMKPSMDEVCASRIEL